MIRLGRSRLRIRDTHRTGARRLPLWNIRSFTIVSRGSLYLEKKSRKPRNSSNRGVRTPELSRCRLRYLGQCATAADRKSGGEGKRGDLGGRRSIKKKKKKKR